MEARARAGRGGDGPAARQPVPDLSAAIAGARAGDEDAFRMIYRAVQPGLLRYLKGLVGDEAEDVASEAWGQVARDIASFRGDSDGFRGWVATIGRHRALDHLRRLRRRPEPAAGPEALIGLTAPEDTAASAMEAVSTDAAIAMITALPADQAEAVLLRVVMGLDAETAAKVLGKRAGAVRTAAHRGLRRLADRLDEAEQRREAERREAERPGAERRPSIGGRYRESPEPGEWDAGRHG